MAYGSIKVDTIVFTNNSVDQSVSISGIIASTSGNLTVTGTISGSTVQATYGTFTNLTGVTTSGTNANFQTITGATGVFTTSLSGATIVSPTGTFTSLTGTTATFTSGIIASGTAALPSLAILSDPNTGIYSPGADQLAISTNGTERSRIDSSGRLLVGTSTSAGNGTLQIQGDSALATNAGTIRLRRGFAAGDFGASSVVLGKLEFGPSDNVVGALIEAYYDANTVGSLADFPSRLVFSTTADGSASPTERMKITSSGDVQFTTHGAIPTDVGEILMGPNQSYGLFFQVAIDGSGSPTTLIQGPTAAGTLVLRAGSSGGVYLNQGGTSWIAVSDERSKEDFLPITDGLTKAASLRAVTGCYKNDPEKTRKAFLIAQDVQQVLPEAVSNVNLSELGLAYSDVIPLLVAALKESKERIETLEARLTAAGI